MPGCDHDGMNPSEYPSHATNVQPASQWAKVLNEKWPSAELARRLRDVDDPIPVTVRIVFETGEERLPGLATRWVNSPTKHVRVAVQDSRLVSGGVWVDPADVERA